MTIWDFGSDENQRRLSLSWRSFFRRYIGFSLERLDVHVIDNLLLKRLRKSCPNLDMLTVSGSCKHIDFDLFPSSLGYLELSVCDPEFGVHYPPNWHTSFNPDHFPNLRCFKISHATHFNEAILDIATLEDLIDLHISWIDYEVTDESFDKLMMMSQLEYLQLQSVGKLPTDYARKILKNLKNLEWINFLDAEELVTFSDVRTLAQLPKLKEMLLPARRRVMLALVKSIPTMNNLTEVTFDDESHFAEIPGPSNVIEILSSLQELRPDVCFVFRNVKVCKENYDLIKDEACVGEEDDADDTDDDDSNDDYDIFDDFSGDEDDDDHHQDDNMD